MEIEGPTTFDQIIVTGDADVSGTLAPEFVSYTPDPNDDFGLITAATYSGMRTAIVQYFRPINPKLSDKRRAGDLRAPYR